MNNALHIRQGRLVDPSAGIDEIGDLFVLNGRIASRAELRGQTPRLVDARGLTVAPALMDLHVHFREPGGEQAETVASGSRAAARGGFGSVVTMPNTVPPVDRARRVRQQTQRARAAGCVRLLPTGCLTLERQGRATADLAAMAAAGAVAFTDDGSVVSDRAVMADAMRQAARLGRPVLDHALDAQQAGRGVMHEGATARRLKLPGIPAQAETDIVRRDVALCRETGCAIHIQHLSAAASADLVRAARREGLPVSAEVTPHHLWFCDEDVATGDPNFKMSPPLRSREDRAALLAAVADGTVSVLATDHAPHAAAAKARGFMDAPCGVIGLETAVAVTYTACVRSGRLSLLEWLRRWTTGPAAVLGRTPPSLAPGTPADIVLLALDEDVTVNAADFASRSANCPFIGLRLGGRVVATFLAGVQTYGDVL
jgi:dihydroorotase